jgi:hypothetical protein
MLDADMTMSEMLHDPMIRQMLRADRVSLGEFATLMEAAASARQRSSAASKRFVSLPAEWGPWRCSAAQTALVQQANLLLKRG